MALQNMTILGGGEWECQRDLHFQSRKKTVKDSKQQKKV